MKKSISLLLILVLLMGSIPVLANDRYIYTTDGDLYDLNGGKMVIDNVKEYVNSYSHLYVLKNDNTLWAKLREMFYITDNVKEYKAIGLTYAIIKFDNTLWIGQLGWCDMKCVMENVKSIEVSQNEILAITNDNKLYIWEFRDYRSEDGVRHTEFGEHEFIMDGVEKVWANSGRYYASKIDGSFWAWGRNIALFYPAGFGMAPWESRSLLGLGDEYKDVDYQEEPAKMAIEYVNELYFMEEYRVAAKTYNDDLYYWGNRLFQSYEEFASAFKVANKPIRVHQNVAEIKDGSVISKDGWLHWRYWYNGIVYGGVKDSAKNILLTKEGKLFKWHFAPYEKPEIELTPVLENVKEICDQYKSGNKVVCLCDDTTLVEIDTQTLKVTSISANVKEAFYCDGDVYFIDNALTLYKWEEGRVSKILENATREVSRINVFINGKKLEADVDPYIKNNFTMVPMRAIFEALGAEVTWDNETKTATAVKGGLEVKITIGENVLCKNGEAIEINVASEIKNNRTIVPVRAISEAFGYIVEWDNETKIVNIIDPYNRTYYIYDENGMVTATKSADGNVIIRYEYLYDENGNVIREWEQHMIKNSDRLFEYTYNEKGRRVSKGVCHVGSIYSLNGHKIDGEYTFTEVEKYFYDEDGTLIYSEYSTGGKRYYIYDEEGKLIREENEGGETIIKYVYYEDGRIDYTENY